MSKTLRDLRIEKGLTQEQLGVAVHSSGQSVSQWESGGWPRPKFLPLLASALGVSAEEVREAIKAGTTNEPI